MMLQQIRNHDILPYFWKLRADASTTMAYRVKPAVEYLDLRALKKVLQTKGDSISDIDLEEILYGSESSPNYSGWTRERIEYSLRHSGFASFECLNRDELFQKMTLNAGIWNFKDRWNAALWQKEQQIWSLRKALRLKWGELSHKLAKSIRLDAPLDNLNLGAGEENHEGYSKVDWGGRQDVYDNIVTLKSFANKSVSKIYSNHVLEHIPRSLIRPLIQRWFEILKPDGVVCARMPDARATVLKIEEHWIEATKEEREKLGFPNYLSREQTFEGIVDVDTAIQVIYGWSNSTPFTWSISNQHKTLWTPELTAQRFQEAGFEIEFCGNLGTLHTAIRCRRPVGLRHERCNAVNQ